MLFYFGEKSPKGDTDANFWRKIPVFKKQSRQIGRNFSPQTCIWATQLMVLQKKLLRVKSKSALGGSPLLLHQKIGKTKKITSVTVGGLFQRAAMRSDGEDEFERKAAVGPDCFPKLLPRLPAQHNFRLYSATSTSLHVKLTFVNPRYQGGRFCTVDAVSLRNRLLQVHRKE